MGTNRKISDKEFFALLRENAGLYARTARAIREQFEIEYTRQAVKIRAEKKPEILADILEETVDIAEDGLLSLMQSENEAVRLRAVELFLKTKGKHRGYIERSQHELEHAGGLRIEVAYVDDGPEDADKP